MSSLALYRRYRPETFAEVIGQQHVTDPLQQALRNNRVNHAYLFSGPRGCGKTTSARILARCLNCEQGPTPTPCGECQSCRDLARNGPGSIDVIEIDAASHGGVDDARELREKAFFGPASSRYKIYIVDEAHMVTPAGFNALLKVVEEPPEHLKFIFATTEPEKVIGTIRSRTHHYPFRLVPPGTLRDYLAGVCERENIPVEESVLPLAVRAGAGSVRDSMSVMDQLLAGAGEDGVTYAMATALLGYTDSALLDDIVDAFAAGDGARVFEVIDRVIEGGHDPRRFVTDLLERLRDLVILAAVPDAVEKTLIDAPGDVIERMRAQAEVFGAAELSRAADIVNTGLTEMRGATAPRLQLELICARVLLPATYGDERSLQARLDRLERGVALGAVGGGAPGAGGPAAGAPAPAGAPGPAGAPAPAPVPAGGAPVPPGAGAGPDAGAPAADAGYAAPAPAPSQPASAPAAAAPPRPRPRPPAAVPPSRAAGPAPGRAVRGPVAVVRAVPVGPGAGPVPGPARPLRAAVPPPVRLRARPRRVPPPRRAAAGRAGCARLVRTRRRRGSGADPADVAADPGGRQEPAALHLDPAQPERAGRRLRRQDAPGRLPERRGPRQLLQRRQRRGAAAGAQRRALGVQWQVEALVDPSGGSGGGPGGPSGPGPGFGAGPGATGGGAGARSAVAAPAAAGPPQQWSAPQPAPGPSSEAGPAPTAAAPAPVPAPAPAPEARARRHRLLRRRPSPAGWGWRTTCPRRTTPIWTTRRSRATT
ncbi:DNA polymerase III subunit gamma and tau [Streptomyces albus]